MNRKHHLNRLTVTVQRQDCGAGIYPLGLYSQKNKEKLKHKESFFFFRWVLKAHEATQGSLQLSFQDSSMLQIIMKREHWRGVGAAEGGTWSDRLRATQ